MIPAVDSGFPAVGRTGGRDGMMGPNQDFADHLSRLRISHDYHLLPDVSHNALRVFQALGEANWDFYRAALGGKASTDGKR